MHCLHMSRKKDARLIRVRLSLLFGPSLSSIHKPIYIIEGICAVHTVRDSIFANDCSFSNLIIVTNEERK